MSNEMPAAAAALREFQHSALKEAQQCPGTGHVEHRLSLLEGDLLKIQLISLDESLQATTTVHLGKLPVKVVEQGCMDIGAPRQEPVRRERQHAFGGRLAPDLLVKLDQAPATQTRLALEHLQTGPQLDQLNSQLHLPHFPKQAILGHSLPPSCPRRQSQKPRSARRSST